MHITTAVLAEELKVKPKTIRKYAKRLGLTPAATVVQTGKRGRPAFTWTKRDAERIRKVAS